MLDKQLAELKQKQQTEPPTPKSEKELVVEKALSDVIKEKTALEGKYAAVREKADDLGNQIAKAERRKQILDNINKSAKNLTKTLLHAATSATKFVFSLPFKAMINGFNKLTKGVRRFGQRLKFVILQGLIFRNLRKYLSEFASSIGDAFKQNQQFAASLANLKGTFWASIAPVVDALAPIIARFLDLIAKLITYLSGLIGILFKIGKASKAAGAGLASAGKSGKEASKNLASWDTIQNLDSGSGGGADSGISPTFGQDFEDAYDKLRAFQELIEKGDWFEIGKYVGEKLAELTQIIDNWIVNTFTPKLVKFAKNLAKFFNGFVQGMNWRLLGKTIGDAVIGILRGIKTWLGEVDWYAVGVAVRDFLLGIPWGEILSEVAGVIQEALIGGLEFFEGLLGIDLTPLKEAVQSLVEIISSLAEVLSGESTLREWWDRLSTGQKVIVVIAGIVAAVVSLVAIIKTVTSVVNGVITAVKLITSPIGLVVLAIAALIAIIILCINHWEEIKAVVIKVWTAITDWVKGAVEKIKDSFVSIWTKWKEITDKIDNAVIGTIHSIIDWVKNAVANIKNFFVGLGTSIANIWTGIKTKVSEVVGGIRDSIKEKIDGIKEFWTGLKTSIVEVFNKVKEKAENTWRDVKEGVKGFINGIIKFINSLISGLEGAINKIVDAVNSISIKIPDWIPKIGGKSLGFNLSYANLKRIPELAQGAVVNPGHEFAAILGDNRHEQEIVSPLSTMKQALLEALQESGMSDGGQIILNIDGRQVATAIVPHMNNASRAYGRSVIR